MIVGILVGLVFLFVSYHLYQGYRSGDLQAYLTKFVARSVIDETSLSPAQKEYLEAGDFESLAKDIEENITPEQVNCAVGVVGEERAKELLVKQDPTPQEILTLSKCL